MQTKYYIGQILKRTNYDYAEVTIESIEDGYVGIKDINGIHYVALDSLDANFAIQEPVPTEQSKQDKQEHQSHSISNSMNNFSSIQEKYYSKD